MLLLVLFSLVIADEPQYRIMEFVNNCKDSTVKIVSTIDPHPDKLPPNDYVCNLARDDANCVQSYNGECTCSAGIIATAGPGETTQYLEHLGLKNNKWVRDSVNYRPWFPDRKYGLWTAAAPAEYTFQQDVDWYDISMIPPGCKSGHWNQYENGYCYGDADGPRIEGNPTCFNSQDCLSKGSPIEPGSFTAGLHPPSEGWYCGMPQSFPFNYKGTQMTIYPCKQHRSNNWVAGMDLNCQNIYSDEIKQAAYDYIRNYAYQCCWSMSQKILGAAAAPGIGASFTIEAVGAEKQCETRKCFIDFTKNPSEWSTTTGCSSGYQYPYDDGYATMRCNPPDTYNDALGVSAKTYRITYCPEGGPYSGGGSNTPVTTSAANIPVTTSAVNPIVTTPASNTPVNGRGVQGCKTPCYGVMMSNNQPACTYGKKYCPSTDYVDTNLNADGIPACYPKTSSSTSCFGCDLSQCSSSSGGGSNTVVTTRAPYPIVTTPASNTPVNGGGKPVHGCNTPCYGVMMSNNQPACTYGMHYCPSKYYIGTNLNANGVPACYKQSSSYCFGCYLGQCTNVGPNPAPAPKPGPGPSPSPQPGPSPRPAPNPSGPCTGNAGKLGFALSTGLMSTPLEGSSLSSVIRDSGVKKFRLYGWSSDVDTISTILSVVPEATFAIEISPNDVDTCADDISDCQSILQKYSAYTNSITHVLVGNEPLNAGARFTTFGKIAPAIRNVASIMRTLGWPSTIRPAVPFSMTVLTDTWPTSNGVFQEPKTSNLKGCAGVCVKSKPGGLMDTLLEQLLESNGVLSIHPYTYFNAKNNMNMLNICLDTTKMMNNMILALKAAMQKLDKSSLPIMITEIGWPTAGSAAATVGNARKFMQSLANSLDQTNLAYYGIDIYGFEFFDESKKTGAPDEPHFGWYSEQGCKKYDIMPATSSRKSIGFATGFVNIHAIHMPQGTCPAHSWEVPAHGRRVKTSWSCCLSCPGKTCYDDCGCQCSKAKYCEDITTKKQGCFEKVGCLWKDNKCVNYPAKASAAKSQEEALAGESAAKLACYRHCRNGGLSESQCEADCDNIETEVAGAISGIRSVFFNASAAMDHRLVSLFAVIGVFSILFYGVQYTRKFVAEEYTPINVDRP